MPPEAWSAPDVQQGRADDQRAPLGILACAGALPIEVARAAEASGRPVHIVGIDGFAAEGIAAFPHERVRLGQIGRMLASFKRAGVRDLVIAGAMQRPNLLTLRVDGGFFRSLPTILALTRGGDDSVLRRVVHFFEGHGLRVVGVGDVAPALIAPSGRLGVREPSSGELQAIARAARLMQALGRFDVGQAVVANPDGIIAVEGVRGTDAMLGDLAPEAPGGGLGKGGVLLKLPKPGQELRIDLPTIGPQSIEKAAAAGLSGVAVAGGASIILERDVVIREAGARDIAVVGLGSEGVSADEAPPGESTFGGGQADHRVEVLSRRAPTPADRRDMYIGRDLMKVLRGHGAGRAAIVTREHVRAISGALPLVPFIRAQGRSTNWGRGIFKRRLGVLVIDGREGAPDLGGLNEDHFRAAAAVGLAGVLYLGLVSGEEARGQVANWSNEAGVFLVASMAAEA